MPAMGLTFTDLQQLSREPTALYPVSLRVVVCWAVQTRANRRIG
jgi:hypothetical protein